MPKLVAVAVLLFFSLVAVPVAIADTRLGDSCDLSVLGLTNKDDFLRFDRSLRSALEKRDAAALALVVDLPLTLNYADGSHVSLNDAATLQLRFDEAFPPALRKIVLAQKPEALFCKYDGLMYGNGELWANLVGDSKAQRLRVVAVNLPDSAADKQKPGARKVQLACDTDKFHVVIDGSDDAPRYRSWNKPHAPPDKPAMELIGTGGSEGTGVCSHRNWKFKNGTVEYSLVENRGCSDGSNPANARAQLEVLIGDKSPLTSWCY